MTQRIQVFEQERLYVGEDGFERPHWQLLAAYAEREGHRFFSLGANSIRFHTYVGALQVGRLLIEVLPKADRGNTSKAEWQSILIEMLQLCRLLPKYVSSEAQLRLRSNSILELYLKMLLEEIQLIVNRGLFRAYRRVEGPSSVLRGRLLLQQQLHAQLNHKEQFFTASDQFDLNHPVHQQLLKALQLMAQLPLPYEMQLMVRYLSGIFRESGVKAHYHSRLHPQTAPHPQYEKALQMAQLLLDQQRPDVRWGEHQVLALMFDMNRLFEAYVYEVLLRTKEDIRVWRQHSRTFWRQHQIRPDLVLELDGRRIVLDTKWRVLTHASPKAEELRQLFVYMQYFDAQVAYLLYPDVFGVPHLPPQAYEGREGLSRLYCGMQFLKVVDQGQLNRQLGQDLIAQLRMYQNKLPA